MRIDPAKLRAGTGILTSDAGLSTASPALQKQLGSRKTRRGPLSFSMLALALLGCCRAPGLVPALLAVDLCQVAIVEPPGQSTSALVTLVSLGHREPGHVPALFAAS